MVRFAEPPVRGDEPPKPGHIDTATHRYGCHGKPRPTATTAHPAQDGYVPDVKSAGGVPARVARMVQVPHVMSTTCQYDRSQFDNACAGCQHQKGALA